MNRLQFIVSSVMAAIAVAVGLKKKPQYRELLNRLSQREREIAGLRFYVPRGSEQSTLVDCADFEDEFIARYPEFQSYIDAHLGHFSQKPTYNIAQQ